MLSISYAYITSWGAALKYPRNSAYKGASLAPRKVPQHKIYLYYKTNAVLWVNMFVFYYEMRPRLVWRLGAC